MTTEQKRVALGMGGAFIASTFLVICALSIDVHSIAADTLAERLRFVSPFLLLPLLALAAGIADIARYRFFNADVIGGSSPASDLSLQIKRAYLQNTTEQVLLALPTYFILTAVLPLQDLALVAALAVWFTVCRILFRVGYGHGAAARSFGFAGTFYSTLMGILIALWFTLPDG